MLLTLPSPVKHQFEPRSPTYDRLFNPKRSSSAGSGPQSVSHHRQSASSGTRPLAGRVQSVAIMATPHRNLPPPAPLGYVEPMRLQTATSGQQQSPFAQQTQHQTQPPPQHQHQQYGLPAPPPQMPGMEDAMHDWLATRAEEEKRRQEEERTRQESMRLEQKKIEQNMLAEVMRSQVPFNLIPAIFLTLGMANASISNSELLHQTIAQLAGYPPSVMMPPAGDVHRDRRGSVAAGQSLPATPHEGPYSALSARGGTMSGPPSAQRTHFSSVPPRMKTHDSAGAVVIGSQTSPQQPEQAPILFHHWQPPSSGTEPSAASASAAAGSSTEQVSSPRKRKAPGAHQSTTMPPSTLRFSEVSDASRPHTRQRSDVSSRNILHPGDDKIITRTRADTAINDETLTPEQQWSARRSQTSPSAAQQSRLPPYPPGRAFGETGSFASGSQEDISGRQSRDIARPGGGSFGRRSSPSEQDPHASRGHEDVEMHER